MFENAEQDVALGHVRLAILDLSNSAAQPMISETGRYVLVFNGEIYNFQDLRSQVADDRSVFRSTGDTEVLLRGLEKYGETFVERLNGMFAFALWDTEKRELLLVRDHLGIKPLYYAEPQAGTLLFASEIKALCAHPGLRREPDFAVLQQHLTFCYACGERTALRGVRRLLPGMILRWSAKDREPRLRRYWQPQFRTPTPMDRREAIADLRQRIDTAVRRQLVADVPVGAFLSGGLDSSLITALATQRKGRDFSSYTITYPPEDNRLDQIAEDAPYARKFATDLGIRFQEVQIRADVASLWPRLVYHLDEPIADPAAITCYLISRLAREDGVPVLLSGQGADELFGGYPSYRAVQAAQLFDVAPRPIRQVVSQLVGLLPGAHAGRGGAFLRRVRRLLRELPQSPEQRFLNYCCTSPAAEVAGILSGDFQHAVFQTDPTGECQTRIANGGLTGLDRFLERDLGVYLPNHNLLYTDKMGMAVGLEARVPLIDVDLVNFVTRLPADWKVSGGSTKRILREASRGIIPDAIIQRRKAGFGAPYRKWLRDDLSDLWDDLTNSHSINQRGWFSPTALQEIRRRSQSGRSDLYMLQWAVLTAELWARAFLDGNPATEATVDTPRLSAAKS